MLKHLSIGAALFAFATVSAHAQEQAAVLQKIEVAGAGFDIVLAMPKAPAATYDLAKSPEALVLHLIGGELALAFDGEEKMLKALNSLQMPACAFHVESKNPTARNPVSVYVVPKGHKLTTAAK